MKLGGGKDFPFDANLECRGPRTIKCMYLQNKPTKTLEITETLRIGLMNYTKKL